MHDFDFGQAKPYNPGDYGLPIWRDKDHLPPETSEEPAVHGEPAETENSMTVEQAKYDLLSLAMEQIGYREGPNNWNKYAAEPAMTQLLGWNAQNQPWCNIFVNACFVACFGLEIGAAMTYQTVGNGSALCRTSADYFKEHGAFVSRPEPGDVIFFYRSGAINHMGIVTRVVGGSVITVEGNSSDMVAERCYSVNDTSIAGYGRPNWALAAGEDINVLSTEPDAPTEPVKRTYMLRLPYLQRGDMGPAVRAAQRMLISYKCGCGPDGADGEFGANTEKAVLKFQVGNRITPDGIIGPATGAKLFGGEVVTETNINGLGAQLAQKIKEGET